MTDGYLPEALRDWLMDIAHRKQIPLEVPAVAAIVALAAVAGRRLGIRARSDTMTGPLCRTSGEWWWPLAE
jgi:hypothetical protein